MIQFWLKVSRPGLWFQTIWLYLFPTSIDDPQKIAWWTGLLLVTWPLNLIVYGWNDIVDFEIDRDNPRKDTFLFGARGSWSQLKTLFWLMPCVAIISTVALVVVDGPRQILVMATIVCTLALYNLPKTGLRSRPPFDLLNAMGYLLIIWLSVWLNRTGPVPWQAIAYLAMFCMHAQLVGEVMDFYPDGESGRVTTCTKIGIVPTKLLIIALVMVEATVLCSVFADYVLGIGLFVAAAVLVVDLVITKAGKYRNSEFLLAGIGMNAAGIASMLWVWWTGSLMRIAV